MEANEVGTANTGKVKFYNQAKGYGFITDDNTGAEFFFHYTGSLDKVEKDDRVQYELAKIMRSGESKTIAQNIRRIKEA